MKDSYSIDGVQIPFDKDWKSVAISLSGGADSALLAYLVSSIAPDDFTIHIISHKRMWKTRPWQSWDSMNVYVWLSQNFPNIRYCRHTNFIAPDVEYGNTGPIIEDEYGKMVSGDNAQIRSFAEYICFKEHVQAHYNAVTRNPIGVDLGGMKERDIDRNDANTHLEVMKHMGVWALHPFRFVDKSWVVAQYKKFDIMDLFNITRSCEGEFEGLDYKNYRLGQIVPVCGTCFWCKEREWAIEQNK